jgi:hypothetical protein
MSNREAKSQGKQWVESPQILAEDLRRRLDFIYQNVFEVRDPDLAGGTGDYAVYQGMVRKFWRSWSPMTAHCGNTAG